jgi:hypothetical protein
MESFNYDKAYHEAMERDIAKTAAMAQKNADSIMKLHFSQIGIIALNVVIIVMLLPQSLPYLLPILKLL